MEQYIEYEHTGILTFYKQIFLNCIHALSLKVNHETGHRQSYS